MNAAQTTAASVRRTVGGSSASSSHCRVSSISPVNSDLTTSAPRPPPSPAARLLLMEVMTLLQQSSASCCAKAPGRTCSLNCGKACRSCVQNAIGCCVVPSLEIRSYRLASSPTSAPLGAEGAGLYLRTHRINHASVTLPLRFAGAFSASPGHKREEGKGTHLTSAEVSSFDAPRHWIVAFM